MVEIFKTNVKGMQQSLRVLSKIRHSSPELFVNFDLEDCDNILRVEGKNVPIHKIINVLLSEGYLCKVIED